MKRKVKCCWLLSLCSLLCWLRKLLGRSCAIFATPAPRPILAALISGITLHHCICICRIVQRPPSSLSQLSACSIRCSVLSACYWLAQTLEMVMAMLEGDDASVGHQRCQSIQRSTAIPEQWIHHAFIAKENDKNAITRERVERVRTKHESHSIVPLNSRITCENCNCKIVSWWICHVVRYCVEQRHDKVTDHHWSRELAVREQKWLAGSK